MSWYTRGRFRRVGEAWPLITAGVLSMMWMPVLGRGFSADDFYMVPTTWSEFIANPFSVEGRPVELLILALLPAHAFVQHATSVSVYLTCIWLMWRLCRRMGLTEWSTFLALSSFFHPAFLWSVTFIAQRNSLLVICFLLLAVLARRTPLKLILIALCSGAKTPYIFQNVVFAFRFVRRGELLASATSLLLVVVFGVAGYVTYYDAASRMGNTLASVPIVIALPLRILKLFEGILYIFAPVQMFAIVPSGPVVALVAYAVLWFVVTRSLRPFRAGPTAHGWIPAMAMTMCVPFVFASEVRVTGEATVLVFLAIASAAQWRLSAYLAVVGILVLNLTGVALNYGAFHSEQYDVRAEPTPIDHSQPAYVYLVWREALRQRILTTLGVSVPERTFE